MSKWKELKTNPQIDRQSEIAQVAEANQIVYSLSAKIRERAKRARLENSKALGPSVSDQTTQRQLILKAVS